MKFKNVSEKTKHIMVDGAWAVVKPGDEFEIAKSGSLHLDPDLEKVVEKEVKKNKDKDKNKDNANEEQETLPEDQESEQPEGDGKKIEKEELDLNNDGVVDEKDSSIAGKVLANSRKKKKASGNLIRLKK